MWTAIVEELYVTYPTPSGNTYEPTEAWPEPLGTLSICQSQAYTELGIVYKSTSPFMTVGMKGGSSEENPIHDVGGKDIVLWFIKCEMMK